MGRGPAGHEGLLDGVPLPRLYHEGGFRSVVNSDMVQSVELLPGGWGAEYGRGLGGLVTVQLRPADKEGTHGSVTSDLLDASADVRTRLSDRVTFEVAGRKSYLDALLPVFTSRDIGQFVPIPKYFDAQMRALVDLSPRETLEIGGIASSDVVDNTVPSEDPTSQQLQTHDAFFQRVWLKWKKQADDGSELSLVPSVGTDSDKLVDQFGLAPTNLRVDSTVATVRGSWRKRLASWVTLTAGADAQLTRSRFARTGSNTSPPRQGDLFVFGQAPSDQLAYDDGTSIAASAAPFATADFALAGGTVHVVPGLRIEPYLLTASRREPAFGDTPPVGIFQESTRVEPRLAVRWSPVPGADVEGRLGRLPPAAPRRRISPRSSAIRRSASSRRSTSLGGVAVGTPDVAVVRDDGVPGHVERPRRRAARCRRRPSPQALLSTGIGRTRGIQFLLRKQVGKRFFGWLSVHALAERARERRRRPLLRRTTSIRRTSLGAVASYDLGGGLRGRRRASATRRASRARR